jgi:O-methyltransferase
LRIAGGGGVSGIQDFSRTNVELVLHKMKYKENCIIKKGFFPETAKGLEDTFAFVSIDADLYEPIYNGLIYLYMILLEIKGIKARKWL